MYRCSYSRGTIGERRVASILQKLNKGKYKIFNNIIMEYNGKPVEIDHVVLSRFGVYIIETKHISGKVKGKVNDEYWVKLKGRHEKFYNPVVQNDIHIKAFKSKLEDEDVPIYSLVVFVNSDVETDAPNVIGDKDLLSMIHRLSRRHISEETLRRLETVIA